MPCVWCVCNTRHKAQGTYMMTSRQKSLLKYAFAALLLFVILRKTDTGEITAYFKKIAFSHIILCLLLVTLAQVSASLRMRFFFLRNGFPIRPGYAIILFYVGAFYNFLLPGGIGGDAYKVIVAKKRLEMSSRQGIRIMIADRASGLCILILMMLATLGTFNIQFPFAAIVLCLSAVITLIGYVLCSHILLKQSPGIMLMSLPYSLVTQMLWLMTLYTLWDSLGSHQDFNAYIVLYAAASVASLIPSPPGGLGVKEGTYFYGATLMNQYGGTSVDGELGVAISLCIFALTFIASLPGVLWLNKVSKEEIWRV